jgi:hypothetical protein
MKSNRGILQHLNLVWVLTFLLVVLVADPLGILKGNFSQDSYSQIRNELSRSNNAKVLLVGSWDDFFSLEYNSYWRKEVSTDFVERSYSEVLDAASLGDDFFNKYLNSKGITHILVPQTTFNRGAINHKFGNRGSIDVKLGDPFFETKASSIGPYASVLLKVGKVSEVNSEASAPKYEITWENIGDPIQKHNVVPEWMKEIVSDLVSQDKSYGYADSKGVLETRMFLADINNKKGGSQITAEDILFFNGLGDAIAKLYQFLIPTARIIGPSPAYM